MPQGQPQGQPQAQQQPQTQPQQQPQEQEPQVATDKSKRDKAARVKYLAYLIWAIIGIVLLAVAAGYVLGQIVAALAIVALAAFIVFVLRVPVAWLERLNVPRWLGALISYVGAILLIALVILIFVPIVWEQAIGLIQLIPVYVPIATSAFNDFYHQYDYLLQDSNIQQIVASLFSAISNWAGSMVTQSAQGAITLGTNVVTSVIVFTMAVIVGYWVLKDLPQIGRELRVIIGPRHEESVLFVASTISKAFGGYLRGMTICAICTGLLAGLGYYLIGLPYPAVLGLLTGLLNFIPYVGPWVAGIVAAIIGLFISPLVMLASIIVTIVAQQFTDIMIMPRVMSSVVDLHPAIVLVGVFAGGALAGFIGLIAAVPLLASAKAIFIYYFEKRTGRDLVQEKGALFRTRPVRRPPSIKLAAPLSHRTHSTGTESKDQATRPEQEENEK